jgi:hypothetical protein
LKVFHQFAVLLRTHILRPTYVGGINADAIIDPLFMRTLMAGADDNDVSAAPLPQDPLQLVAASIDR